MTLTTDAIRRFYLFLTVFYYFGFLSFTDRLLRGGKPEDLLSANASGNILKQLLGVALLFMSLYLLLKVDKKLLIKSILANYWWIILLGFFFASVGWSHEPGVSFRRMIAFTTLVIVAFCLVCTFEANSLLYFIAKSIVVAACLGLLYIFIAPQTALGGEGERANMFIGIMGDKNGGARLYAYGLLILIGLDKYKHIQHKAMIAVLAVCVVAANSASAIVMVVGGISLIVLFKVMHTRIASINLKHVVLIFIILVAGAVIMNYMYEFLLMLLGRDPTLTNRQIIWQLMDAYVENERLFGYGFGAFWASDAVLDFVDRWGYIGNAHSGYYEALLNGGLVGLFIIFGIMLKSFKDLIEKYIKLPEGKNIVSAMIAILILQAVTNYVAYIVMNHNSADMVIFTIIALIASFPQSKTYLRKGI